MFKSIEYTDWDYGNDVANYRLIDSDFVIIVDVDEDAVKDPYLLSMSLIQAIEKEYTKRNLRFVPNLVMFYNFVEKTLGYGFNSIISIHFEHYPNVSKEFYDKYLTDIKKYLLLC